VTVSFATIKAQKSSRDLASRSGQISVVDASSRRWSRSFGKECLLADRVVTARDGKQCQACDSWPAGRACPNKRGCTWADIWQWDLSGSGRRYGIRNRGDAC